MLPGWSDKTMAAAAQVTRETAVAVAVEMGTAVSQSSRPPIPADSYAAYFCRHE